MERGVRKVIELTKKSKSTGGPSPPKEASSGYRSREGNDAYRKLVAVLGTMIVASAKIPVASVIVIVIVVATSIRRSAIRSSPVKTTAVIFVLMGLGRGNDPTETGDGQGDS
jgi:hypothetical protein